AIIQFSYDAAGVALLCRLIAPLYQAVASSRDRVLLPGESAGILLYELIKLYFEAHFVASNLAFGTEKTGQIVTSTAAVNANMWLCLSYLLLGVLARGYTLAEVKEKFDVYKKRFGHDFGDDDDHRMAVFDSNLRYIDSENAKGLSYTLKIGPFAHLTNAEFRETMFRKSPRFSSQRSRGTATNIEESSRSIEELPKSVNYVAKGWVTDVKDQMNCGSCWAFSATGALEGLHKNVSGELVSLSEEELIDCSKDYGNYGCWGGLMNESFRYVADHGLGAEKDYP
ncbi:hypothetical protein FOZ63_003072, partial [Perkinsus olseni]